MKHDIQNIKHDQIMKVYSGKDGKCSCGCAGKYSYNSKYVTEGSKDRGYEVSHDEVNDKQITRVLNTIKKNEDDIDFDESEFVSVVVGERCYVAYFLPTQGN